MATVICMGYTYIFFLEFDPDSAYCSKAVSLGPNSSDLTIGLYMCRFYPFKGAVSRFYHDFERFKNTPRSYITQQKRFYLRKHHSTNDNNPLGSEDG